MNKDYGHKIVTVKQSSIPGQGAGRGGQHLDLYSDQRKYSGSPTLDRDFGFGREISLRALLCCFVVQWRGLEVG